MSETEGSTSVTIKHGKGYEETWTVFRGTNGELRNDIADYFGMADEYVASVTLHELVIAATHLAHGTGNVAAVLGATPIGIIEQMTAGPTGAAAWDAFDGKSITAPPVEVPAAPHAALVTALETAATTDVLKELWAKNQAAFSDADVKAAYSTRGKALKAAA
jgi:hypothetical protein